jgi:predicted nucleotidyltransferase
MPQDDRTGHLFSALDAVSGLLQDKTVQGVIIGGVAASLLGRPRFTNDIDLLVLDLDDRLPQFLQKLSEFGIRPRISDSVEFALKSRVLLLRHEKSGINVDVAMGILPFEIEAVKRCRMESACGLKLILPTPEDLIIFKAISRRPRDMEDIQAIAGRHPELDKKRVLATVRQFADVLEMDEIYQDISALLQSASKA